MRRAGVAIGAAVLVLLIAGGCMVAQYNKLVVLTQKVSGQWAQVETVLQRRADLIPNLVETVKGYMKHEQRVFKMITDARAKLAEARTPAEAARADEELMRALSRLLFLAENHPQIRANENFLRLQDQLEGAENRVAVERRRYNQAVEEYNRRVGSFPAFLFARLFGFPLQRQYFRAEERAHQVPRVRF